MDGGRQSGLAGSRDISLDVPLGGYRVISNLGIKEGRARAASQCMRDDRASVKVTLRSNDTSR